MPAQAKRALLLLPNLLGENKYHTPFLPSSVDKAVCSLEGLIAESEPAGRRYLARFPTPTPTRNIPIALYNEHTPDSHIDFLLEPLLKGERWGLISDGGLPCIADPGAKLVRRAHQVGIPVQAFIGPSSLIMALMLSGLTGQRFQFHGYLAKDSVERRRQIQHLEMVSQRERSTQLFIEAPYRNRPLLETLLETLQDNCWLCVAWDLTLPTQGVLSQQAKIWKKSPLPDLHKKNAIFLLQADA